MSETANVLTRPRRVPPLNVDEHGKFSLLMLFPLALGVGTASGSFPTALILVLVGHYMLYSLKQAATVDKTHWTISLWGTFFAWGLLAQAFVAETGLVDRVFQFLLSFIN